MPTFYIILCLESWWSGHDRAHNWEDKKGDKATTHGHLLAQFCMLRKRHSDMAALAAVSKGNAHVQ
jgi:hypothetical protein